MAEPEKKIPSTVPELIEAYGGNAQFARALDILPSTASEMKRSESIRARYWPKIIATAPSHGVEGVDADSLMRMHVQVPA